MDERSGIIMRMIWDYISEKSENQDIPSKQKKFLLYNTIIRTLIPLCVCIVIGLFTGFNINWYKTTFMITGYSAIVIGYIGGFLFLCRKI